MAKKILTVKKAINVVEKMKKDNDKRTFDYLKGSGTDVAYLDGKTAAFNEVLHALKGEK